jgi:hypothetical protein
MNMFKMALLGGAALAVSAAGAQADDLEALKAQIESLNARVASMEAAPSVPAGYSLLTVADAKATNVPGMTAQENASFGGDVTVISVLPTADAPAGATIEWSGYVRAAIALSSVDFDDPLLNDTDSADIFARGRLNMTARTDTAVGEVGVRLRIEGNGEGIDPGGGFLDVDMPIAWGWWAMTPELTLGGGFQGTLGYVSAYDSCAVCATIDNAPVYFTGDTSQLRLTYASGPLSMAIALEDASHYSNPWGGSENDFGVAGEIAYAGDAFNAEISALWHGTDNGGITDDSYQIGLGLGFNLGDMANILMSVAAGQTNFGDEYVHASILGHMNLSDEVFAELALGVAEGDGAVVDALGVMGGVYYAPVSQLTLGLEAEYVATDSPVESDALFGGFVAIWAF